MEDSVVLDDVMDDTVADTDRKLSFLLRNIPHFKFFY